MKSTHEHERHMLYAKSPVVCVWVKVVSPHDGGEFRDFGPHMYIERLREPFRMEN